MKKPKILISDDHEGFRDSLVNSPILKSKFYILEAESGEKTIEIIEKNPEIECIILDYDFKKFGTTKSISGLDVLNHLKEKSPHIPIIMMSGITEGRGTVAVESIKNHAIDFLDKPFQIKTLVEKLDSIIIENQKGKSAKEAQKKLSDLGFITQSRLMADFCLEVTKAANNDLNIMIAGETGTGKTYIARIIHQLSKRKSKKFEEFHCGIISNDVNSFKSQLFGHTKGAFTHAIQFKKGVFELVDDGTLLLDDITTMPMEVQKGLLQVIENKYFSRFGDEANKIPFRARIISTTNQNLNESIKDNSFRNDLKYRLCGDILNIPPLRKRTEDIPAIINHYIQNLDNDKLKNKVFSEDSINLLQRQPWIGNVRQLLHVISRAVYHEENDEISISTIKTELLKEYDLSQNCCLDFDTNKVENLETKIEKLRKEIIIESLKKHKGNLTAVARTLGYQNHNSIQYWLKQYKIDAKEFKI